MSDTKHTEISSDGDQPEFDVSNLLPVEMSEALENAPPEAKKVLQLSMASFFGIANRTSPEVEAMKKVTSEHISAMLKTQHSAMENTFRANERKRWFDLAIILVAVGFVIALAIILKDTPDLLDSVLKLGIGGVLGVIGGFGVGFRKGKSEE